MPQLYAFEVAPWCPSHAAPDRVFEAADDDHARDLARHMLPKDGETFAQLRQSVAESAWGDGQTLAAWNITGPTTTPHLNTAGDAPPPFGTYQARLAHRA